MSKLNFAIDLKILSVILLVVFCYTNNSLWAQPEMTLWYVPNAKHDMGHQHGAGAEAMIPCGWNYYHSYDGKSRIIEYGIKNEGNQPLILDLPLAFDADEALEYSIMEQPSKTVLQPNDDIHFKVKYTPLGAYRPAKAVLNIPSSDPHSSNCSLNFRVGGPSIRERPLPFIVNSCFEKSIGSTDFDVDNTIDEIITTTRTLDEKNNIILQKEVLVENQDPVFELGDRTTKRTFNANNQILTEEIVSTIAFASIIISQMVTNTYDANNNLTIKVFEEESMFFGTATITDEYIYDTNNNLVRLNRTIIDNFGMDSFTFTYEYDANKNVTKETITEDASSIVVSTTTYMYDANNNLTKKEINDVIDPPTIIMNTYDANNKLETSMKSQAGVVITTTNTYNALNSLSTQKVLNQGGFPSDVEIQYAFTYDANNRLINRKEEVFEGTMLSFVQTIVVTPCGFPQPSIADPCNCFDPLNKKDNQDGITHFHDVLSVTGTPGDAVVLQTGNTNFLNNNLAQITDGTNLGMIPASGVLEYDFFHASGASGAITLNVGGVLLNPFDISVCEAKSCIVIPTMSQWGVLVFGLLILNMGVFFIQRQYLVTNN